MHTTCDKPYMDRKGRAEVQNSHYIQTDQWVRAGSVIQTALHPTFQSFRVKRVICRSCGPLAGTGRKAWRRRKSSSADSWWRTRWGGRGGTAPDTSPHTWPGRVCRALPLAASSRGPWASGGPTHSRARGTRSAAPACVCGSSGRSLAPLPWSSTASASAWSI